MDTKTIETKVQEIEVTVSKIANYVENLNRLFIAGGVTNPEVAEAIVRLETTTSDASHITIGTLSVANGGTGYSTVEDIRAGKDSEGNTITSTYMNLTGSQIITGQKTFDNLSATTPSINDNSTKVATTEFVKSQGYVTASGTVANCSGNAATATQFADFQSITLTGDITGTASSQAGWSIATTLANSGVTAGNYGNSQNLTLSFGDLFNIPYITVDAKGRITSIENFTVKLPEASISNNIYDVATTDTDGLMSSTDKEKLDSIAVNANNYSHPTTSGNKHIPSGGSQGQILRWASDGTAAWGADNNTTYTLASLGIGNVKNYDQSKAIKAITRNGTTFTYTCLDGTTGTFTQQDNNTTYSNFVKSGTGAAAGLVPSPGTTAGTTKYLREDGTWQVPPDTNTVYTHPTTSGNKHIPAGGSAGQILRWASDGTAAWGNDTDTTYTLASLGIGNVKNYDQSKAIKAITRSGTTFTYTCLDGTTGTFTQQDNNTTYTAMTGASSSADGAAGLVPKPTKGNQNKFLRADGTWQTPTNTTYSNMTAATADAAGTAGLVPAPAAGKQASFLRGDGKWVVPTNTTYSAGTGLALSGTTFSVSSTAGTSTLEWNKEVTLYTVGGAAIKAKLPANPNKDTHWTTKLIAGVSDSTANAASTNGNTYLRLFDDSTARNSIKLVGAGKTTVTSDANGVITITSTDANTTYANMTGATADAAGKAGLVPAPAAGKQTSFLRGDGVWVVPTNTWTAMKGATSSANGTAGYVPAPPTAGYNTKYLRADGTWQVPPNTTYTAGTGLSLSGTTFSLALTKALVTTALGYTPPTTDTNTWTAFKGATSSAAGTAGYVPAPAKGDQAKFFRADGTWQMPPNTTYTFTNKAATLAWNTAVTIATVGGTDITVKLPANPNTNTTYSAGAGLSLSGTTFFVNSKAGTSTLAWNSEVTLGTVGNLAIKAKLPANPNTDTHWTTAFFAGAKSVKSNAATTNGNTYLKVYDNDTLRGQLNIKGTGATTVTSDANGVITINSTDTNTNTDTLVTQNISSSSGFFPILACPTASATTNQGAKTSIFSQHAQLSPSSGFLSIGPVLYLKHHVVDATVTPSSNYAISVTAKDKNDVIFGALNFWSYSNGGKAVMLTLSYPTSESNSNEYTNIFGCTGKTEASKECFLDGKTVRPVTDKSGITTLGTSSVKWGQIYSSNSTISTSDKREKDSIEYISSSLLDAWEDINWMQFQFKKSISEKGYDKARLHHGLIAQDLISIFEKQNLDVSRYGFFCYDKWDAIDDILDDSGKIIEKGLSSGDAYSLRYTEALCIEAAYQRRENQRLKDRITMLENTVSNLENIISNFETRFAQIGA